MLRNQYVFAGFYASLLTRFIVSKTDACQKKAARILNSQMV